MLCLMLNGTRLREEKRKGRLPEVYWFKRTIPTRVLYITLCESCRKYFHGAVTSFLGQLNHIVLTILTLPPSPRTAQHRITPRHPRPHCTPLTRYFNSLHLFKVLHSTLYHNSEGLDEVKPWGYWLSSLATYQFFYIRQPLIVKQSRSVWQIKNGARITLFM